MRSSVTKTVCDHLNSEVFSGIGYEFVRLDTLDWDPELTRDLTCYVVPDQSKRAVIDRRPSVQTILKMYSVDFLFIKFLESGKQEEVDALNDAVELIADRILTATFLDTNGSPTYTYLPREMDEMNLPEEWQLTHQENEEENRYGGTYMKYYRVRLEETRGSHA